jgi:hypothetical protein
MSPGKTIGSSLLRWLKPQTTVKYGPPGKVRTCAVELGLAHEPLENPAMPTTAATRAAPPRRRPVRAGR